MSMKRIMLGVAALALAAPAAAQRRGSVEFGAFGNAASFDEVLSLKSGFGAGGRIGVFLGSRLSLEFEGANIHASRPNGLADADVGILSGRLVLLPVKAGALSLLVGGGAGVSTETFFLHSYGADALVGAKIALGDMVALRVDGVYDWLTNTTPKWRTYKTLRVGLSFYRHPPLDVRTETVASGAPVMIRVDTVRMIRVDTVRAAVALPMGEATTICLATGEDTQVLVTAQGDTLVGPGRTSIRVLRTGGVAFVGQYAGEREWFEKDQPVTFEGRQFRKSDGEIRMSCPDLLRVGQYDGVPLFARREATAPYQQLYVPVRPGVWQMFENLRQTRG